MIHKRLPAKATLKRLAFGIPAVFAAGLSAAQLIELRGMAERIDFTQTADPVWIGSQLSSEILELHSAILQYELGQLSQEEVSRQLNVAWSRLRLMQVGKMGKVVEELNVSPSRLGAIELGFEAIETSLPSVETTVPESAWPRGDSSSEIASELAGEAHLISLKLAQQRSQLVSEFRASLLSVSSDITLLFATYLILTLSLMAFFARELKLSKQHNQALSDLRRKDKENLRARDHMMSTISHELRTPLTSILGGLKLLKGGAVGALSQKALAIVEVTERNSDRLLSLVNEILDAQRMFSGELSVDLKAGNLKVALHKVMEEVRGFSELEGVTLSTEMPHGDAWANFDEARLGQAVLNIVSNAIKFSPTGETVLVSLSRRGDCWRISIKDRGPGIAAEEHDNVFQRFHQVNPGIYSNRKSSGLGLSIAKQIIEAHEGSIGLESAIGNGTYFWIDLPASLEIATVSSAVEPDRYHIKIEAD